MMDSLIDGVGEIMDDVYEVDDDFMDKLQGVMMNQNENPPKVKGGCHCGAVEFEVRLLAGFNTARRCTCSMCVRRGVIPVSAELADLTIMRGEDKLSCYQFGTKTAEHYFCSQCGIYTHHRRRSNPNQYGINPACLEGFDIFDLADVPILDGTKHPRDNPYGKVKWIGDLSHRRRD